MDQERELKLLLASYEKKYQDHWVKVKIYFLLFPGDGFWLSKMWAKQKYPFPYTPDVLHRYSTNGLVAMLKAQTSI